MKSFFNRVLLVCILLSTLTNIRAQESPEIPKINVYLDLYAGVKMVSHDLAFSPFKDSKVVFAELTLGYYDNSKKFHSYYTWGKGDSTRIYSRNHLKELTNAQVNFGFWGVSPKRNNKEVIYKSGKDGDIPIVEFFRDVFETSGREILQLNEKPHDFTLLIYHPWSQEKIRNYLNEKGVTLQSEYFFLLWNREEKLLPDSLDKMEEPLGQIDIHVPSSSPHMFILQYTPREPSVAEYKTIDKKGEESLWQIIKGISSQLQDTIPVQSDKSLIMFRKPFDYNLAGIKDPDTLNLHNRIFTSEIVPGKVDTLRYYPIQYHLLYIDASDNARDLDKGHIFKHIDALVNVPATAFIVYLSNGKSPKIARNKEEYLALMDDLFNITFLDPVFDTDALELTSILRDSVVKDFEVLIHLFMPPDNFNPRLEIFKTMLSNKQITPLPVIYKYPYSTREKFGFEYDNKYIFYD